LQYEAKAGSCYGRGVANRRGRITQLCKKAEEIVPMRRISTLVTVAALMAAMLALEGAASAQSTPQPVDPPEQVAQLRQQFEGLTAEQIAAQGYAAEGPCVPSPTGVGAMGIHALNPELLEAQFPNGTMDPANPPVLLLDENEEVMGVEWEAADVGQGQMEMFGQTIEIQPGHPGWRSPTTCCTSTSSRRQGALRHESADRL
jgi:hypothetical protein